MNNEQTIMTNQQVYALERFVRLIRRGTDLLVIYSIPMTSQ